jgi:hypothetical protein
MLNIMLQWAELTALIFYVLGTLVFSGLALLFLYNKKEKPIFSYYSSLSAAAGICFAFFLYNYGF